MIADSDFFMHQLDPESGEFVPLKPWKGATGAKTVEESQKLVEGHVSSAKKTVEKWRLVVTIGDPCNCLGDLPRTSLIGKDELEVFDFGAFFNGQLEKTCPIIIVGQGHEQKKWNDDRKLAVQRYLGSIRGEACKIWSKLIAEDVIAMNLADHVLPIQLSVVFEDARLKPFGEFSFREFSFGEEIADAKERRNSMLPFLQKWPQKVELVEGKPVVVAVCYVEKAADGKNYV